MAERQDASRLTAPLRARIGDHHDRPAQVIMADQFTAALHATITDPWFQDMPLRGSINQIVDNTDILDDPGQYRRLRSLDNQQPLSLPADNTSAGRIDVLSWGAGRFS